MIVNYNSPTRGGNARIGKNVEDVGGPPPWQFSRVMQLPWLATLLLLSFVLSVTGARAQSTVNYAFSTNATGSLVLDKNGNAINMAAGTTALVASGSDQGVSDVTPIGFTFPFMGNTYSQFTVSANGILQLGATAVSTTTYVASGGSSTSPRFAAMAGDLATASSASGGGVISKLFGTSAADYCLVVQWTDYLYWNSATGLGVWQMRLYPNGTVEYVYGAMTTGTTVYSSGYQIGFSTGTAAGSLRSVDSATNASSTSAFTTMTYTTSTNVANLHSTADGSRRVYTFTPPATPAAPTTLSFSAIAGSTTTVNWVDNSTSEYSFLVTRATDAAFTQNVVTANVASTTSAATGGAYSSAQTGLNFGMTYYYKVQAVNEGGPSAAVSGSQATVAGNLSGIKTVGPSGDYATLTAAFAAINANGLSGNIQLQLISGYVSTVEPSFPVATSTATAVGSYTVTLYPTASGLSITSASTTGTLNLNGTTNLIIDGRVNQTGAMDLVIANTATAGYALQFVNDANNNTVRYVSIRGVNTSTTSGVVVFAGTTGANGNDNNTIANSEIRDGATTYVNGIYSSGTTTTAAQYNDNNVISSNNIYNFFSAGSATNGILVASGNAGWTISGNSLYQTAARTYTSANTHTGINVSNGSSGSGYTINNNFVGGSAANAGGSAYALSGTVATLFRGITLSAGTGAASNVQGNTIANISLASTSGTSTMPGLFSGINISAGIVNVGTTTANTVGATTGTGSIAIVSTTSGSVSTGIYATSSSALDIRNNNVASVSLTGGAAIGYTFHGIYTAGSPSTRIISSNNIGSATASSIVVGTTATTASSTFNGIYEAGSPTTLTTNGNEIRNASVLSAIGTIFGMRASTTQFTANNNLIHDLSSASSLVATSATTVYGYYNLASPTVENMSGNQIYNLTASVNSSATTNVVGGIYTNTTSGTKTWSGNTIRSLSLTNSNTGTSFVYGIRTLSSTPTIVKNKIYGLTVNSSAGAVYGLSIESSNGTVSVYNNIIGGLSAPTSSLTAPAVSVAGIYISSTSAQTHNIFNNTIHLTGAGGTNFGTAAIYANSTPTVVLRNNVLSNQTTPSGTGKAVAYQRSSTTLTSYGAASNNNLFYAGTPSSTTAIFFDGTNTYQDLASYKTAMGTRDQASVTENPPFLSTTGSDATFLHMNTTTPTYIEGGGSAIAEVTDDFDGDARNASTPDIGADEFTGTPIGCTGATAGATSATVTAICVSGTTVLSASGYSSGNGTTYQWQSASDSAFTTPANIGTATNAYANLSQTVTTTAYYRLKVTCTNGGAVAYTTPVQVVVSNPTVASTTPGSRCGIGTVTLQATPSAGNTLNWYAAASGGSVLGTGNSFVTPSISTTTNFYVEPAGAATLGASGKTAPATSDTGSSLTNWGIVFDVLSPLTLQSVDVYSTAAGTVDIKIMDATLTTELFSTGNVAVVNGGATTPNVIPINFSLPVGTGYRMLIKAYSGANIVRGSTALSFPYTSPALNVTSSEWGGTTTGTYYYFYNLKYSASCLGTRTAVAATVNTPPALTLSSNSATVCAGASSSTVTVTAGLADYNTFVWSPSTGVSGTAATGYTFNSATSGTYTLTASQTGGSQCVTTATFALSVVAAPTITSVTASPATMCAGSISTLTANLPSATVPGYTLAGSAGTYTAVTGTATTAIGDDYAQGDLPIGFTFNYNGTDFTKFAAASNGFIELGSTLTYTGNTASGWLPSTNALASRANIIAGFWDDNNTTGGTLLYTTTGTVGSRVLTVQWTNMHVGDTGSSTSPTLSMQIKLYEGTNQIQIVYGSKSGTLTSPTASVGLSGAVGSYLSVTPATPASASTKSSTTENTSVTDANIASGTTFTFTAPQTATVTWSPIANLYTDAAATVAYTGTAATTVYAKLNAATTFTATATNAANCTATKTVSVSLNNPTVSPIQNGNATVCNGSTVQLTDASPGGTWSSSDTAIATIDQNGLVTSHAAGTATISYAVTDLGCTTTVTTTVTVNGVVTATNPVAQTVVTGQNATFSVTASGSVTGYQWMVSTDGGDTFENVVDGAPYSGATTNTLTITATPDYLNENMYMVVVSAAAPCAAFESGAASLNVGDTGIAQDPSGSTLCSSGTGTATFTVVASGTVDTYAWQVDSGLGYQNITDGTFGNLTYSGATTASLTVSGITLANSGLNFRVVVEGPANGATSNPATLTVNQGVVVTTPPSSASTCYSGGTTTFSVASTGAATGYQWQYSADGTTYNNVVNGTPVGATYANATTATLSVTTTAATPASGTYFYRAVIAAAAPCGSATSSGAQLQFYTPSITGQPAAATVFAGNSATFTVATSEATPSFQWQYAASASGPWTNVVSGTPANITYANATSATLTVNVLGGATAAANRYYRAVVTSASCSVNSNAALLTTTNYCFPTYSAGPGTVDHIANVTLGTLNNTSGPSASPYYTVFDNATVPNIQQLTNANVSVTFGNDTSNYCAVWIDFNQNGVFEASEGVASTASSAGTAVANGTSVVSIPVPLTALTGKTRMRVRGGDDVAISLTQACGASNDVDGEAEDYFVNIVAAPACSGTPSAATASVSQASVCISGSVVLTASNIPSGATGLSTQWYNTATGAISGANAATYTTPVLTATASYFLRVTCADSGLYSDSNTVTVTVNSPSVTATLPAARCGIGTVTLGATASSGAVLNWYAAATGGASIATGASFTTPSISATTNYYVSASIGGSNETVGKASSTGSDGNYIGTGSGIVFNALSAFTLNSAVIYPVGSGTATFALLNSAGTELAVTSSITVTGTGVATPVTVPLNFSVPVGTGYRLVLKSYTGITGLIRDFSASFPYTSASCSVTGGWLTSASTSYYFFYNLSISTGCEGARTMVTATVNTPPALTLSSNALTLCSGNTSSAITLTSNAANYQNYVWSPSTGVSGSAAGWTFNPTATTTYTLLASQTSGSLCANTATVTVTVNASPLASAVSPASQTICNGTVLTLTVGSSGGTGTFGTGTTAPSATSFPNPLSSYYGGSKHQMLFTASELTAQGLVAGSKINAVTFYLNAIGGGALTNFTIRMGATANAALSGFVSGTSAVYGPSTFTPSATGLVSFALTTPYTWNGTSNLVVETVYNGGNSGNGSGTRTRTSTTTNNSVYYGASDSISGGTAGFDALTTYDTSSASTSRPNMTFTYTNIVPTWTPATGLYTDAAATVAYTGGAVATIYAKPTVSTTYTATYTSPNGCTATSTSTITVNQYYNFYVDADGDHYGTGAPVSLCATSASAAPTGYASVAGDCDDTLAAVNPGHAEVLYNGIDDNCDGNLDEGHQLLSSVLPSQCGTTLASISSYVGAVSFSAPVDGYRFKVVNTTTNAVQVYDSPYPHFQFSQLASYEYAKTYSISVMVRRNGVWLGYYGPSCLVSTPAILDAGGAASISPSQCGGTLASISTLIATTSIPNVTGYRFRVTNLADGGDYAVQVLERTTNWFSLTLLTRYNYGTEYTVEVAVKSNTGVWSGYGSPCSVSSPALPMLSNCGATVATAGTLISVPSKDRAQAYRFEITNMNTFAQITVDRSTNYFSFNNVPGYTSGAQYAVRVAIQTSGYWSPFGEACTITAPGAARTIVKDDNDEAQAAVEFRAIAYPNPYVQSFGFQMETSSDEKVQVKIYDMVGKLLDEREFAVDQVEKQQFGDRYPSGVYNIVVTQAGFVKTLRVIKR